jgi:hypothetical protein
MNSTIRFITDATVGLKTDAGVDEVVMTDLGVIKQGTKVRIETTSPANGYFYAVLLDATDEGVTVLFPVADSLAPVSDGQAIIVDWITLPRAGQLRLAVSPTPVPASEWATLGGRDGDARHTSGCTDQPSDGLSTDA